MNYRTQKEYIENRLGEISLIYDEGTRVGQLYSLQEELTKTKSQKGGHYMGVGKACSEGIHQTQRLMMGGE